MKKKYCFIALIILVTLSSGCSKEQTKSTTDKNKSTATTTEDSKKETQKETPKDATATTDPKTDTSSAAEKETVKVNVYYGNANADGLLVEEVTVEAITPEILLQELNKKNIISSDIRVIKCEMTEVDGEKAIELDLSIEFDGYINNKGTAGETITMESICNTFLDAYDCKLIHITVAGGLLGTGHKEYPGYMQFYDLK